MIMNEDYCSYELALKLKACGFDEPCDHYYTPNKVMRIAKDNALAPEITNNRFLDEIDDGCCTAVPLWHAQKWLREKKGIAINVIAHDGGLYDYDIVFLPNAIETENIPDRSPWCRTYEEALSEGIDSALELIEQENK